MIARRSPPLCKQREPCRSPFHAESGPWSSMLTISSGRHRLPLSPLRVVRLSSGLGRSGAHAVIHADRQFGREVRRAGESRFIRPCAIGSGLTGESQRVRITIWRGGRPCRRPDPLALPRRKANAPTSTTFKAVHLMCDARTGAVRNPAGEMAPGTRIYLARKADRRRSDLRFSG